MENRIPTSSPAITPFIRAKRVPAGLSNSAIDAQFYQFSSINNETVATTWSNFAVYSSSIIIISGLSNRISVQVVGPNAVVGVGALSRAAWLLLTSRSKPVSLTVSVQVDRVTIVSDLACSMLVLESRRLLKRIRDGQGSRSSSSFPSF
jgi:hypothetical protein